MLVSDGKISLSEKLSYASMNFGQSLLSMVVSTYILYFYTDVLLLPAAAISVMLLIVRIFDGAIDPFIGFFMDKRISGTGKFTGYLRVCFLPFCFLSALMFASAGVAKERQLMMSFLLYLGWSVVLSVMDSANSGLCISITANQSERPVINTFKVTASVLATLIVSYGTLIFVDFFGGGDERRGFFLTSALFAVAGALAILPGALIVKERNYRKTNGFSMRECVRVLGKNKKLIFFLAMYVSHQIASGLKTQTVIYYFKYAYGRIDMVPMFFLAGRIGSLSAQPLIVHFAKKAKAIHLMIGAYIIAGMFMVLILFCRSSMWLLILMGAASSVASAFPANLSFTYLGEIADEISDLENSSFSAITASMLSLSNQAGSAVAGSVVALVLHLSTYIPNTAQSDSSMFGIRMCFIGFTSIMYLTSGVFALLSHVYGNRQSRR